MKTFKNFLTEAKYQIIDPKGKPFSTSNSYEDAVDELESMGEDPKTSKYKIKKGGKELDWSMKESLTEARNQKDSFERALKARDAEIEIVKATHPLAKGSYSIKVYAPSVDKSVVFYADVTQFRGDFMS